MGLWKRLTGGADRAEFVAEVVARFRTAVGEVEYDETSFSLRGRGHTVFLASFWSQYQQAKARDRDAVIDRVIASARDLETPSPSTFEAVRDQLRPMVHDHTYWSASRLRLRALGLAVDQALPVVRPFGAHHAVSVVVDLPSSMRSVAGAELTEWGRDFDALLAVATQNLERASTARWPVERPGVWRAPYDDGYAVARLVLPRLFRALGARGAPVVLALGAGVVLVADADNTASMEALGELGEQVFDLPKPMAPIPLTLDGDRWVEYVLPAAHPAKRAFDLLRYRFLVNSYEQQKAQLKALRGAENGPFVAQYKAMQGATGDLLSISTLTENLVTLLPRTDHVLVMTPGPTPQDYRVMAEVPWDVFARIVSLELVPDLAPPRYATDGQLSDAQRQALREASTRR